MGMKKTTSLKASFWKFLCMLLIGLIGAVAIPFSLILAGTSTGLITYADYSERCTKDLAPVIAATPDLADVQLPMGCEYLVLDKNYQVTETTLEGDDLDRAMEYAISGQRNTPEILLYIFIAINCIAVCVILTAKFAKNMRTQLSPLFEATRQVAEQNLDFEVGHSKIKEFEDVLCSFANMKDNLKISLEKQWNAEQLQREQIAALAHDLKTPLTVIQGNIDLINETELDDEQRLYAGYITESSEQIGIYIKVLIDISRTIAGYQLHLEKFDIADYMGQIKAQASSLCLTKGICLQLETGANLGTLKADKLLLERAIMNVISNALDYSPPQGTIYVTVQKTDCFLHISITDEGGGFTPEALHHAQKQFFMGDKSRTSNMHFGMGLYITSSIIKQHGGQLVLSNSKKTGGAQVIIKIPY